MSLLDEMDQDVVAYRPERSGEGVEGVVIALDITGSEYTDEPIPVITVKQDDGVIRGIRGYHSVLRGNLKDADPQVGDRLAIVYEGKKQNRKGTGSYHSYKVRVARGSTAAVAGGSQAADDEPPF